MSVITTRKSVLWGVIVLFLAMPLVLTTCDSPMGMGKPIDFEPPVLTPDPYRSPMYVGLGATLTGTVWDNTAVDRVILRDSKTGEELFRAALERGAALNDKGERCDRWEINLDFSEDRNGEKISAEIVAFDVVGNSGDVSIAVVNLIIDIRAPIVEYIWIARSSTRQASFESYYKLLALQTEDSRGEKSANVDKYQNGAFTINANIGESETRIEEVKLSLYDVRDLNTPLLELEPDAGSSSFTPRWFISEETILNAGDQRWAGYSSSYYDTDTNPRYYYNVLITAIDRSRNESSDETNLIADDEGYFCMWRKADEPKGILDPAMGEIVSRGSPLLVEFFDDDSVKSAYAGLLTREQWEGKRDIASGVKVMNGDEYADDKQRLAWLINRIDVGGAIYNWEYDRYSTAGESNKIKQLINGEPLAELLHYVPTGNGEEDFGEYVLFTVTDDHKLPPHDLVTSARSTYNDTRIGRHYPISIIDENAPLIVFDTSTSGTRSTDPTWSGHSPEENTFPELRAGQFFEISGYTLRENSSGNNKIIKFRMAWIPFGINDGRPDMSITEVQNALSADNYPNSFSDSPKLKDVIQHWEFKDFSEVPGADSSKLLDNTRKIGNLATANPQERVGTDDNYGIYNKQVFRKEFDVLGGIDNIKTEYKNFEYNGERENKNKLFIFYVEDNLGHKVFRQLRLLGMERAPELAVYNIFDYVTDTSTLPDLPDITATSNNGDIREGNYLSSLKAANESLTFFNTLKATVLDNSNTETGLKDAVLQRKTDSYELFTRNTTLIYWIMAKKGGKIALDKITMQDVTYDVDVTNPVVLGGTFDSTDTQALSYIEYFPDVTQRVFLFTATDRLGNVAELRRTIAITNTAQLESITTTTTDGTYGTTDEIVLKANFTGLVRVETGTGGRRPQLTIRYPMSTNGTTIDRYDIRSIECEPVTGSVLSLEFKFKAPENSIGRPETNFRNRLLTMYNDKSLTGNYVNDAGATVDCTNTLLNDALFEAYEINRPIRLNGASIKDALRDETAFLPGYKIGPSRMPYWYDEKKSLQERKAIYLKGTLPRIVSLSKGGGGGKTGYDTNNFYFKEGETIEFTLSSTTTVPLNIIRPLGTPKLRYQIRENNGTTLRPSATTYYTSAFEYLRPAGSNGMVFSLPIGALGDTGADTPYDGRLVNVSLIADSANTIVDEVRNPVVASTVAATYLDTLPPSSSTNVFIKRPPAAPVTTFTPTVTAVDGVYNYNTKPTMTIATLEGWLLDTWERTQYSLDGGLTWQTYPTAGVTIDDGLKEIRTRYVDKAGNQGAEFSRTVNVKTIFPQLLAVNSVQSSGWYKIGDAIEFVLDFAEPVRVSNATNVTITLRDKSTLTTNIGGGDEPTYQITLNAVTNASLSTSVRFNFDAIGTGSNRRKLMQNGLYVSEIQLAGLSDSFGNTGGTGTGTYNGTNISMTDNGGYTCPNLTATLRVGGIKPVGTMNPVSSQVLATDTDLTKNNRVITITFNEDVMKGAGTITVRPRGTYAIPPVFEDQGYYIDQSGNRSNTMADGKTYVDSFYDVYNALPAGGTPNYRQYLTQGTSMSALTLNARTGQSAGPYKKTTHGLIEGSGYSGNYTAGTTANGPNPAIGFMVPDTATKWVLDYQYAITQNVAAVNNIRTALNAAKFRWQEIDVVSTSITGRTVTITLNQPLLKGLQWDLYYDAGTFTDLAGNSADGITAGNYWFWSNGVQAPVIRVNRRSFDARTANWQNRVDQNRGGAYGLPGNTTNWNTATIAVTDDNGWGITDFNSVHYRVESESPGATIQVGTYRGVTSNTTGSGRATGAWSGTIQAANSGATSITNNVNWTTATDTAGAWVLNNVIRRAGSTGTYYTITTKNGTDERRNFTNDVRVVRSYNRDLTEIQLKDVARTTSTASQGVITGFTALESSKNYVVATATVNGSDTVFGYEGIFRTVIALLYGSNRNNGVLLVEGSNVKNGMPSVAGFPVRDAEESGDNRFVKAFFCDNSSNPATTTGTQFYWVSTEIVCEWYFLKWGGNNNGTHQRSGEANNYLMVGYGDLTYGYNVYSSGENN